jgi:hypothetical protein
VCFSGTERVCERWCRPTATDGRRNGHGRNGEQVTVASTARIRPSPYAPAMFVPRSSADLSNLNQRRARDPVSSTPHPRATEPRRPAGFARTPEQPDAPVSGNPCELGTRQLVMSFLRESEQQLLAVGDLQATDAPPHPAAPRDAPVSVTVYRGLVRWRRNRGVAPTVRTCDTCLAEPAVSDRDPWAMPGLRVSSGRERARLQEVVNHCAAPSVAGNSGGDDPFLTITPQAISADARSHNYAANSRLRVPGAADCGGFHAAA